MIGKTNATGTGGIEPTGTLNISENGTYDVTNYASAEVNVQAVASNEYVLKKISYGYKAIFIANYSSTSNTYGTTIQLEAINNGS